MEALREARRWLEGQREHAVEPKQDDRNND
jgi:hypothetical protein